jgi:ribonuclease HI
MGWVGERVAESSGMLRTGDREARPGTLKSMNGTLFGEMEPTAKALDGWFVAHCDGGSRGNPGPAGYGAVVEDPQGRVVARLSEYLGKQTNNYAEYSGLLAVLKWAKENGTRSLRVISDSELMVNQMKGRYKVGSPSLRPLWEEAKQLAVRLERFEMRHTLRGGNQEADRLANEAMDRGMGKKAGGVGVVGKSAGHQASRSAGTEATRGDGGASPNRQRQVFEGLVKNGVVHLIDGELPEGVLVKVVWE